MAGTWWQPDQHRFSGTLPQIRQSVKAGHHVASSSLACIHTCTRTHVHTQRIETEMEIEKGRRRESQSNFRKMSFKQKQWLWKGISVVSSFNLQRMKCHWTAPLIIPSPRAAIYLDTKGHHYGAFFYYENVHFGCSHTVILSGNIMITSEKGFPRDWRPQASSALPLCVPANSGVPMPACWVFSYCLLCCVSLLNNMALRKMPQVVSLPAGDSLRSFIVWWQVGAFRQQLSPVIFITNMESKCSFKSIGASFGLLSFVVWALGLSPTFLGVLVKHSDAEVFPLRTQYIHSTLWHCLCFLHCRHVMCIE